MRDDGKAEERVDFITTQHTAKPHGHTDDKIITRNATEFDASKERVAIFIA